MSASTCWSCRSLLRQRLKAQIFCLQRGRRSISANARPSLSWYNDTVAPTPTQLEAAENFFLNHKPRKLWTATEWRKHNDAEKTPLGLIPEVAFLGRSNVGKSSLLNALLLSPALNHVGPRPGKTTTMHAWAVSPTDPTTGGAIKGMNGDMETKCAVLDMPGYGHASHDDWGEEIMSYLKNRKQLKRAFVLIDGRHGLKSGDLTMLRLLRKQGVSAQIVVSKCDKIGELEGRQVVQKTWKDVQENVKGPGLGLLGEVLVVGSLGDGRRNDRVHYKEMRGVDEVQWAVLRATGLDRYAINVATHGIKKANAPNRQGKAEEDLAIRVATNSYSLPIQPQLPDRAPAQPNPEPQPQHPAQVSLQLESELQSQSSLRIEPAFSWPAKIRQPSSFTTEATSTPPTSPYEALEPMNSPALPSELPPTSLNQQFPVILSKLPQQLSKVEEFSTEANSRREPFDVRFGSTNKDLVASRPITMRSRQVDYPKADYSIATERDSAQSLSPGASALWTGSAVGGIAELEAMMARTASARRKPASSKGGSRGRQPVPYTEQSSQEVLLKQAKPKEAWTGSAVGGMDDLEAMMKRTTRGREPVKKKPGKRQRY